RFFRENPAPRRIARNTIETPTHPLLFFDAFFFHGRESSAEGCRLSLETFFSLGRPKRLRNTKMPPAGRGVGPRAAAIREVPLEEQAKVGKPPSGPLSPIDGLLALAIAILREDEFDPGVLGRYHPTPHFGCHHKGHHYNGP